MITDPETYVYRYPTWACRVSTDIASDLPGSSGNGPPTLKSELSTILKPLRVLRTSGGQQLDYADIEVMTSSPLINRSEQPVEFSKMVDILFPNNPTYTSIDVLDVTQWYSAGANTRVLLGDYAEEAESVTSGESLMGRVELRPYHFGKVFGGMIFENSSGPGQIEMMGTPAVFNPMVDGVVLGNMSNITYGFGDASDPFIWIDPEIGLTTYALAYHEQTASLWTLEEAVKSIVKMCNEDEFYLTYAGGTFTDAPVIRNIVLENGHYLPYYLDGLLHPHGFNWYVDPATSAQNTGDELIYEKPTIRVYKKGVGPAKKLYFQPPGQLLDLSKSNVNQYDVRRRIGDAVTAVRVFGDKLRAEVTLRLYPGWGNDGDDFTAEELTIDGGSAYQAHKTAHRLWVAGEGGDYYGTRTGLYEFSDPPDLSPIFAITLGNDGTTVGQRFSNDTLQRRRVMEPPLTYQGDADNRVRRELFVEYKIGFGETWTEVTSEIGTFSALADRIGIIFTGNSPPAELVSAFPAGGGGVFLRITGTIASDHSLYNLGSDGYVSGSVQGRLNMATINAQDRFRHWFVVGKPSPDRPELQTHLYASVLKDDSAGADVHDDRAEIETYAAEIIKPMLHADYDGNFVIPGWTTYYEIGDLLTEIEGRNITLNQAAAPGEAYMQITGIEWSLSDDGGPQTRLIVDRGIREYYDPGSQGQAGRMVGGNTVSNPLTGQIDKREDHTAHWQVIESSLGHNVQVFVPSPALSGYTMPNR